MEDMCKEKAIQLLDSLMADYDVTPRTFEEFWKENECNTSLAVIPYKKYLLRRYLSSMCAGMYTEAGLILKEIEAPFEQREPIKVIYDNDDIVLVPLPIHNGVYVCYSMEYFIGPNDTLYYRPIKVLHSAFRYVKGEVKEATKLDTLQEMFSAYLFLSGMYTVDQISASWRQRVYARRLAEKIPRALMGDDNDIICSALLGAMNYIDMK